MAEHKFAVPRGKLGQYLRLLRHEQAGLESLSLQVPENLIVEQNVEVSGVMEAERVRQEQGMLAKQIMECFYRKDWSCFEPEASRSAITPGGWTKVFGASDSDVCNRAFAEPIFQPSSETRADWDGYDVSLHQIDGEAEYRRFHGGRLDPGPYYTRRALMAHDLSHPPWLLSARRFRRLQRLPCMSSGIPTMEVHRSRCTVCRGSGERERDGEMFEYLNHHIRPCKQAVERKEVRSLLRHRPRTRASTPSHVDTLPEAAQHSSLNEYATSDHPKSFINEPIRSSVGKTAVSPGKFATIIPLQAPCRASARKQATMDNHDDKMRL